MLETTSVPILDWGVIFVNGANADEEIFDIRKANEVLELLGDARLRGY